jgi:hypothetical protein
MTLILPVEKRVKKSQTFQVLRTTPFGFPAPLAGLALRQPDRLRSVRLAA